VRQAAAPVPSPHSPAQQHASSSPQSTRHQSDSDFANGLLFGEILARTAPCASRASGGGPMTTTTTTTTSFPLHGLENCTSAAQKAANWSVVQKAARARGLGHLFTSAAADAISRAEGCAAAEALTALHAALVLGEGRGLAEVARPARLRSPAAAAAEAGWVAVGGGVASLSSRSPSPASASAASLLSRRPADRSVRCVSPDLAAMRAAAYAAALAEVTTTGGGGNGGNGASSSNSSNHHRGARRR